METDRKTHSSQYYGTDLGNCRAGYRNHDDGTGGAVFSRFGCKASDRGMGQYDERDQKSFDDTAMGHAIAGNRYFYLGCYLQSVW